jgi:hypothetical protein
MLSKYSTIEWQYQPPKNYLKEDTE